jgi:hypothetical protein
MTANDLQSTHDSLRPNLVGRIERLPKPTNLDNYGDNLLNGADAGKKFSLELGGNAVHRH